MALKKPAQAKPATDAKNKFEAEDGASSAVETQAGEGQTAATEPAAAAEPAAGVVVETQHEKAELVPVDKTAVAVARQPSAAALAVIQQIPKLDDIIGVVHDNVRVDWNSLPNIQATNGNFKLKDGNGIILGPEIHFQLVSTQDNFAVTPGVDDDEASQYVRYSDDGKMLKDGVTTVAEHLKILKDLGYAKAKCQQRIVLVGAMTKCDKKPDLVGELFQIDLPPTSLSKFKTFKIQTAWKTAKGKLDAENVLFVKATAEPTSANGRDWTMVNFAASDVRAE